MILSRAIKNYSLLTIALALAVITIPLKNNYNSWAMVAFCIIAFFHTPFPQSLRKAWRHKYWLLCVLFFCWLCATWFWDVSGGFSIKNVESYAIFLFLPFVMTAMPKLTSRSLVIGCYAFVATIIVVCLICLTKSYMAYRETGDARFFYYHYLSSGMGLNAVYLSNYCIFCIYWLLYYQFLYTGKKPFYVPFAVNLLVFIFLFAVIFLLASKMSVALLVLLMLFMLVYIGYVKKALIKSVLVVAALIGVTWLLSDRLFYLHWRMSELRFKKYSGSEDDQNGLAARLVTWESAWELMKERPLLGYGLKGAGDELVKKYAEKGFQLGIPERYNSHNQYLETGIRSGLVGLLLLLLLLFIPFRTAVRDKRILLLLVLLHLMVVCLVETAMEYQQELTFYWFFILLFYYHYPIAEKEGALTGGATELKTGS